MGVPILQGYGLTETAPVLSCVSPKDIDFCSVGSPLENIKIRIYNPDDSGIGEIVARGPNIMKGYYKEKKKTKEVLKRGWFYTGDFGYLKDEKLYIKGRLKNVIVSKGGKNIYPEEIEEKLLESDFIEEVLVIGDGEPEAIIYPNYEEFDVLAQQNEQQEITDEYIYDVLKDEINEMNKLMAGYKRIRNIKLRKEEFPKTSTRKIKRYLFMEDKRKV
jgi:long-chain acyl-CoA synthetase